MDSSKRETRNLNRKVELREVDGVPHLVGYAVVWDAMSLPLGFIGFRERIRKGAFTECLQRGDDVFAFCQHNSDYVLGRRSVGTLKLTEDDTGLAVDIAVPDTSYGRDLIVSVQRGDISGMSFGFEVLSDDWRLENGEDMRDVLKAQLFEVSPVTYPAYPDTSVAVRAHRQRKLSRLKQAENALKIREALLK